VVHVCHPPSPFQFCCHAPGQTFPFLYDFFWRSLYGIAPRTPPLRLNTLSLRNHLAPFARPPSDVIVYLLPPRQAGSSIPPIPFNARCASPRLSRFASCRPPNYPRPRDTVCLYQPSGILCPQSITSLFFTRARPWVPHLSN